MNDSDIPSHSLCSLYHRSPIWIRIHHTYVLCTSFHRTMVHVQQLFMFWYFILIDIVLFKQWNVTKNYTIFSCGVTSTHYNCSCILRLISLTNFNAQFLYSLTICMLHYNPGHVSSINTPIFRRKNCITTALWEQTAVQYALIRHTVQPFTESDDTRCCGNTIFPPEDGRVDARNMSRIVM
jgi:hypothetical protein